MEMTVFQYDLYFFVCIFLSTMVGRFFGRISGYRQRVREETQESENIIVYNVYVKTEDGIDRYYELETDRFIQSDVTPEELHDIVAKQYPNKEITLVISRAHESI